MPRHAVVIGGGFAGLRAAVSLADAGLHVTVLESRVGLGGRARSFLDPASGETVDNGQHLLIAGYRRTLAFLGRLGTRDKVYFQERLKVGFVEPGGRKTSLDCPRAPAPWHLLLGMGRSRRLEFRDKLRLCRIRRDLGSPPGNDGETVEQWLLRMGQSAHAREGFWRPLTVAALNEEPVRASAVGLKQVLRAMMMGSSSDARLGVPRVGLSEMYVSAAERAITEKGGRLFVNRPAAGLEVEGRKTKAVLLADGSKVAADAVVSAVPPSALLRILPPFLGEGALGKALALFSTSPIISVNLWLDRPLPGPLFMALIGTRFHWVFNKPEIFSRHPAPGTPEGAGYVALIMSAAFDFISRPNEEMARIAWEDLAACFPSVRGAQVRRSQVVRERDATVSLGLGMERLRPAACTEMENLFLAGDWTATGLPATIESAVVSGESAAAVLLQRFR